MDIVVLKIDLPEFQLTAGDMGTIAHIYDKHKAFEVEFVTTDGTTLAVVTLTPDQIRLASEKKEIFHVRKVA